jgi:hypothetical protein
MNPPSKWAESSARSIGATLCLWDSRVQHGADIDRRERIVAGIARYLDEAENRGHRRAVEETAIASIHKAVAAERERGAKARAILDDVMRCLRWSTERDDIRDPLYERLVEQVCNGVGYGALMDSAQRCWRRSAQRRGDPIGGEHIAGPARSTVDGWLRAYDSLPDALPPDGNGAEGRVLHIERGDHREGE